MKKSYSCVVGLREANVGSGVGLFNRTLADKLGVPYVLLDDYRFALDDLPLFSLKFDELSLAQVERLEVEFAHHGRGRRHALFLHALDNSSVEGRALRSAVRVLCGNDLIYHTLAAKFPCVPLVRAFAPSLIPDGYEQLCRPSGLSCFYFGMASKVDERRFTRLRDLMDEAGCEFQLICSLSVHQTSDGRCLPQVVDFLSNCLGDRFLFLGTMTDKGIAYFLNTCPVFVGFYRGGVRSNNTTFNTALRFGNKIISNLDEHSPTEVADVPHVLNIDCAGPAELKAFLATPHPSESRATPRFDWDDLVARCSTAEVVRYPTGFEAKVA